MVYIASTLDNVSGFNSAQSSHKHDYPDHCFGYADEYAIPCDHAGGTFWYHPHHHGSTALQMGGGAMGVLIVEDRQDVHDVPDQIINMPELVLTIQVRRRQRPKKL